MTASSPGPEELGRMDGDWSYPGEPVGAELARQEDDLAAYLAATASDEPPSEDAGTWVDPDTGPPVSAANEAADAPGEFIDHDGDGPGGLGFESGSVLDGLAPGPVLAAALADVVAAGLDTLSDDALAGVMLAFRRCESRAAAGLVAATAELVRRREAAGPRAAEHLDDEAAMLLAWTRPAAQRLLGSGVGLARLPATWAALWAGRIDRLKADVLVYETELLSDELAAAVELLVIEDAARLTTSQLRARLRRAVLAADPEAARRRAAAAVRQARVELRDEPSGATAALAGRDLPVGGALAADQRVDAAARELKAAGVAATLPQLRAAVFLGLLTGTDPRNFLPPGTSGDEPEAGTSTATAVGPATLRGSVNLTMPLASWLGHGFSPGDIAGFGPLTSDTCRDVADWIAASPGTRWCVTLTNQTGRAVGHACARRPPPPRGDPARLAAWLARLKIEPLQAGTCSHSREVPGYRIPARLHHLVKIRQRTCVNPICTRPAIKCDEDHTVPWDQGGRTCECNLGPASRGCHRTKQAPGWRLEQPTPGNFVWHLPSGRTVTSKPDTYPT